jgi:hypothetical protein
LFSLSYELDLYILFRINSVFKELMRLGGSYKCLVRLESSLFGYVNEDACTLRNTNQHEWFPGNGCKTVKQVEFY